MAYHVSLESGEHLEAQVELNLSRKARPFSFAISNRAIYIPRIKLIAKSDPYYFERLPLKHIERVTVRRMRPYGLWLLAILMVPIGLVSTIWMMEPVLRNWPGKHQISGWPIAVFVCGFLVPFAAKGRFALEVEFIGGRYRWKPPLVVDTTSKRKISQTFQTLVEAFHAVGLRVIDGRVVEGRK